MSVSKSHLEQQVYIGYVRRRYEASSRLVERVLRAISNDQKRYLQSMGVWNLLGACINQMHSKVPPQVGSNPGIHLGRQFIKQLKLSTPQRFLLLDTLEACGVEEMRAKMFEVIQKRSRERQLLDRLKVADRFHCEACQALVLIEATGVKIPTAAPSYQIAWEKIDTNVIRFNVVRESKPGISQEQ